MLAKRVIPCLDVKDGKVVKGTEFVNLKEVGRPPELAERYSRQGADEITFLDIAASKESRGTTLGLVKETAERVFVPLTVGGGIRTADDVHNALLAGADKVSMNSAAVAHPEVISESAERFGRQCVVVAIDAKRTGKNTMAKRQKKDLWWYIKKEYGISGLKRKFTKQTGIPLTKAVVEETSVPVVASGGCGGIDDIYRVFAETDCSAALAASIFHYGECTVDDVHEYLRERGIEVR